MKHSINHILIAKKQFDGSTKKVLYVVGLKDCNPPIEYEELAEKEFEKH